MSKLPVEERFIDLSDYGRAPARLIANFLKETSVTPIHVTMMFIVTGCLAIACILLERFWLAAFFLVLKSILDAADGELARVKQTPSYTGRYFDSVSDMILNFFFLYSISYNSSTSLVWVITAFLAMQLQGTLYNYYYVILRNKVNGDTTSRVFEDQPPVALPGEKQSIVNTWFWLYTCCYVVFDKAIYWLDPRAETAERYPKWFMTAVSAFGLGFQLLIISIMLCAGFADAIIDFFVGYSALIFIFIGIRRYVNRVATPEPF
ncbi:MAG: CDP-alcohol phosphatidyltransferase family protein [Halieaceae bacterium]|nr:CDP-alcohol phosphatidyltransferase family protein [Halieaceae bacterium]